MTTENDPSQIKSLVEALKHKAFIQHKKMEEEAPCLIVETQISQSFRMQRGLLFQVDLENEEHIIKLQNVFASPQKNKNAVEILFDFGGAQ